MTEIDTLERAITVLLEQFAARRATLIAEALRRITMAPEAERAAINADYAARMDHAEALHVARLHALKADLQDLKRLRDNPTDVRLQRNECEAAAFGLYLHRCGDVIGDMQKEPERKAKLDRLIDQANATRDNTDGRDVDPFHVQLKKDADNLFRGAFDRVARDEAKEQADRLLRELEALKSRDEDEPPAGGWVW